MLGQLNLEGKDKVEVAIERLQSLNELNMSEKGQKYHLAYSGGKDSVVIKKLADMAGVEYEAVYRHTSVDPPELIKFIQSQKDVKIDYPKDDEGNRITMWSLIASKTMPPTRIIRYCCADLKESAGDGMLTITGVRWAESATRRANQGLVTIYSLSKKEREILTESGYFSSSARGGVVLTNDNEESREMLEYCYQRRKTVVNPIIDWTTAEVWEFIREFKVDYCELYDCGYKRLGCIGCPMASRKAKEKEFARYPVYKGNYLRAFRRMLLNIADNKLETSFQTPEGVFEWWLNGKKTDVERRRLTSDEVQALKEWRYKES